MEDASACIGNEMAIHSEKTISDLPDELLVSIVSRLTVKEAARTSLVARRWRFLWTHRYELEFVDLHMMTRCWSIDFFNEFDSLKLRFVNSVNAVLKLHNSATIQQFKIRFNLDRCFTHDINGWLKFAFAKRVKVLELNLGPVLLPGIFKKHYPFPNICHPIKRLHLLPLDFSSFNFLEALYLKHVEVSGEVLEYFLANCPHLEVLDVGYSERLSNLRIDGPSLCLKRLAVKSRTIQRLEINAPNLVSLEYGGPLIPVCLKNASLLANLSLEAADDSSLVEQFLGFRSCFTQLETLKLKHTFLRGTLRYCRFPVLPKLKKLVYSAVANDRQDLISVKSLINVAPALHHFIMIFIHDNPSIHGEREIRCPAVLPHPCLKVFEVVGFAGRRPDLELIWYILNTAVSLDKLILNPYPALPEGISLPEKELGRVSKARKRVKLVKDKIPSGVKLIIC